MHKSATFHSTPLVKNQKPRQLDENLQLPPKSDTIVPTPTEAAFRNMFDDSLIRSWTMIRKVTKYGFITSNDLRVRGPVILINGSLFLWNVPQGSFGQDKNRIDGVFDEWNKDFLKIFEIITPKPELLIFGTGKMSVPIPLKIRDYIHKLGLQIEYSDT
ncbi:17405_t:CDS:2, partial [Gigaspora margarita]